MFTKTYFVASTFLAIAMAQVAPLRDHCYKDGTRNTQELNCGQYINTFCDTAASAKINPGESIGRCFSTASPDKACDFLVTLLSASETQPVGSFSADVCKDAMNTILNKCPSGGYELVAPDGGPTYKMVADPNRASCRELHDGN